MSNLNLLYDRAIELGLLKQSDLFCEYSDEPIKCEDFFVVLERFLYQNRYLYFDQNEKSFFINAEAKDNYSEFLQTLKAQ